MEINVNVYRYVYVCICMYGMYVSMNGCMYEYMCGCMYIGVYMYVCMNYYIFFLDMESLPTLNSLQSAILNEDIECEVGSGIAAFC
jgi:hypothetical protein